MLRIIKKATKIYTPKTKLNLVEIPDNVLSMSHEDLYDQLENHITIFLSTDLTDTNHQHSIKSHTSVLEMYAMEALLRITEGKLNRRNGQNKIYESVERIFDTQDSYNINRLFSSLRRSIHFDGIDPLDTKYHKWFKNRASYGSKALLRVLKEVEYVKIPTAQEVEHA